MKKKRTMAEGDVNCNEIGDKVPDGSKEVVNNMVEIFKLSPQEIYAMLVECKMDENKAATRLLDQGEFQEVKRKGNKKKQPKNIQEDRELMNDGAETSSEQIVDNDLAGSSTSSAILGPNPPLNTEVITGFGSETSSKQIINNHLAAPSPTTVIRGPSLPSNSDLTNVKAVPSSRLATSSFTYASVLKKNLGSSKESVNEGASISNTNLGNDDCGGSRLLCDEDNNRNDEQNLTNDPSTSVVETDESVKELPDLFGSEMNSSVTNPNAATQETDEPSQENQHKIPSATDFTFDNSPVVAPSEPSRNVASEQIADQINSNETHEPTQENHVVVPSQPSLQMQSYNNSFLETRHQDPLFYPEPSFGRMRSSVLVNQQALNHHYGNTMNFPHWQPVQIGGENYYNLYPNTFIDELRINLNLNDTSGIFGDVLNNYPQLQPRENYMLPSGFQQNDYRNSNNNTNHDLSIASAMLSRYRNIVLPYNVPSVYGSANDFWFPSANSRFGTGVFFPRHHLIKCYYCGRFQPPQ